MSDSISPQTPSETPEDGFETPVERKKSPLELVKERQAAFSKNRNSKGSKSGGGEKAGGVAEAPSAKPMRSSASKQGG